MLISKDVMPITWCQDLKLNIHLIVFMIGIVVASFFGGMYVLVALYTGLDYNTATGIYHLLTDNIIIGVCPAMIISAIFGFLAISQFMSLASIFRIIKYRSDEMT